MNTFIPHIVTLEIFEGPFDFLIHLIQKSEIDATAICLHKIIEQYLQQQESSLDSGAEFIGTAASLLWLKSKSLLPQIEQSQIAEDPTLDANFDMVNQLVDYCRFKQAAKELSHLEHQQSAFYSRGYDQAVDPKKNLGIEHISLHDLASLFQQVLSRIKEVQGDVRDEDWKVSDKISFLREILKQQNPLLFNALFMEEMSRIELIVLFLAILELMKSGEIRVVRDQMQQIIITT
jgi:segregation and condensation protein A